MPKRRRRPSNQPALVRHDGSLCATFVNTVCEQRTSIETYADLLVWGQENARLGAADAQRLARTAEERPDAAEAVARKAGELRDRLERVLRGLAAHRRPAASDLEDSESSVQRGLFCLVD